MGEPVVAILGTRYADDFTHERAALAPLGARLVAGDGGSAERILAVAEGADVVLAGSRPVFSAEVIAGLRAGGALRGIVRYGVGTDTVDLEAARRHGIAVGRVADAGTEAVAAHALALSLALLRRLPDADRAVRAGQWGVAGLRPLHSPSALTAGVVGAGRIGRLLARHLAALGMHVLAHDPVADPGPDAEAVGLDELLTRSDLVSLHAPGGPDGRPLLGADELARMRPGSVLVNTSRGSLVDLPALARALAQGRPGWAGLDVYPTEPPDAGELARLLDGVADRVLLSPHTAWYTEESEADMRRKTVAEAARLLRGEPLLDPVVDPGTTDPGTTDPGRDGP